MTKYEKIVVPVVEKFLNMGLTDKNEIIAKTVEETGVPRPTVRRIIRDMRNEMQDKIKILQSDDYSLPS